MCITACLSKGEDPWDAALLLSAQHTVHLGAGPGEAELLSEPTGKAGRRIPWVTPEGRGWEEERRLGLPGERASENSFSGDNKQRMAKRIYKDRGMYCEMQCPLKYSECVTFSHDPLTFSKASFVYWCV